MKILGRLFTLLVLSLMALAFQNCSKPNSVLSGTAIDKSLIQASISDSLVTVAFYRGGWMSMVGQADFSHDMVLSFLETGQVNVFAVDPQSKCQKYGVLSNTQKEQLIHMLDSLNLIMAKDSEVIPIADAGDERLTLTYLTGHQKIVHLIKAAAQPGDYYLRTASELSSFLQEVGDSLATTTCK